MITREENEGGDEIRRLTGKVGQSVAVLWGEEKGGVGAMRSVITIRQSQRTSGDVQGT